MKIFSGPVFGYNLEIDMINSNSGKSVLKHCYMDALLTVLFRDKQKIERVVTEDNVHFILIDIYEEEKVKQDVLMHSVFVLTDEPESKMVEFIVISPYKHLEQIGGALSQFVLGSGLQVSTLSVAQQELQAFYLEWTNYVNEFRDERFLTFKAFAKQNVDRLLLQSPILIDWVGYIDLKPNQKPTMHLLGESVSSTSAIKSSEIKVSGASSICDELACLLTYYNNGLGHFDLYLNK